MPEISRFLGTVIAILYRDHEPPHFHATYGEFEITVGIRDGLVTGRFPQRALGHVQFARNRQPLKPIAPLE